MSPRRTLPLIAALFAGASLAVETTKKTWDFEQDEPGKIAKGFTNEESDKTPGDEKWHTLRVTMAGSKITCYFDGRKYLEADNATFPEAGMIGLWSKADAQSYFDDLTVSE